MTDRQIPRPATAPHDHYPHRELTGVHSGARVTIWEPITQQERDAVAAAGPVILGHPWWAALPSEAAVRR